MAREILVTREYPHPPARVWSILTDGEELAGWLMPNDFVAEPGRAFTMTTRPRPGFDGIIHCQVLELDPPRRMVWSWRSGTLDSTVSFDLAETAGGTRPTLRQTGFRGARLFLAWLAMRAGWEKKILARLGARVAARQPIAGGGESPRATP